MKTKILHIILILSIIMLPHSLEATRGEHVASKHKASDGKRKIRREVRKAADTMQSAHTSAEEGEGDDTKTEKIDKRTVRTAGVEAAVAEQGAEEKPLESGFVHFIKSPEFKENAKKTVGCCASFGFKIFKGIRKEQTSLKAGEALDTGKIIEVIIIAAAETLQEKGLIEGLTPSAKRATKSRRMVLNPSRGGEQHVETHAVTLVISQFDQQGDEIDVHQHVYKVANEEQEIIAADAIFQATLDRLNDQEDMRDEADVVREGRGVRTRRGIAPATQSTPAIKICVFYTHGGHKFQKTCMISVAGDQIEDEGFKHVHDNNDVAADDNDNDPDAPVMDVLPKHRKKGSHRHKSHSHKSHEASTRDEI